MAGLVRAVGRELYDQDVTMELLKNGEVTKSEGTMVCHVVLKVTIVSSPSASVASGDISAGGGGGEVVSQISRRANNFNIVLLPLTPLISPLMFNNIFPFHVVFDKNLTIKQCGERISSAYHRSSLQTGNLQFGDIFELIQPLMPLSFNRILRFCNATYILELKMPISDSLSKRNNIIAKPTRLTLKGEWNKLYLIQIAYR